MGFAESPQNLKAVLEGSGFTPNFGQHLTPSSRVRGARANPGPAAALLLSQHMVTSTLRNVISDPAPFPEHAIIDFSEYTASATEKKAKKLAHLANARGWCYRPDPAP
ncbi:hypothetical protein [Kyrpidia sp.]|uniref:hypothetical protein n=1 Tax=Kyrpidia sp. TaxID=2073077 RepID=UPI00258A22A2|nr:hypothetical protein [Kyrpidia sp.]MCL6576330.1 hypothetical protein [Kyrpidia sp.]